MTRLYVFIGLSMACASVGAQNLSVGFGVDCKEPESIAISVKNPASSQQTIPQAMLPWNSPRLIRWSAFSLRDGGSTKLKRVHSAGNFIRDVTIPANGYVGGVVNLPSMFADFSTLRRDSGIIVLFELPDSRSGTVSAMLGTSGFVFLPRKRFFTNGCPVLVQSP